MKSLLVILILSFQFQAQAVSLAGVLGMRSSDADTDLANATIKNRTGMQAGVLGWTNFQGRIGGRSGFVYTQRYATLGPTQSGTVNFEYSYFDVPLTGTVQIGSWAWIFAGPVLSFNQSKDVTCSAVATCSPFDVKSFIVPFQMGLDFKFAPQFGGEIFYEYVSGELSKNLSNMSSVGANILVYFE
jgi:hypothetical protein